MRVADSTEDCRMPNVMNLIHKGYNHKTPINFEFWWCHFYCSRVMPLYKLKSCWFFVPFSSLSLPQPNVMKRIHKASYHRTQIKFGFWWHHFYCSRVMPFKNWTIAYLFIYISYFSFTQPNVMNCIHNAYYHKTQIKFEFLLASLIPF